MLVGQSLKSLLPAWWQARNILPGCCWACALPITTADARIGFDGVNLLDPNGGPVAFHTSWDRRVPHARLWCRQVADAYEHHWVTATTSQRRRITCLSPAWLHDGWVECAAGAACPGDEATHAHGISCWGAPPPGVRPAASCGHRWCCGGVG